MEKTIIFPEKEAKYFDLKMKNISDTIIGLHNIAFINEPKSLTKDIMQLTDFIHLLKAKILGHIPHRYEIPTLMKSICELSTEIEMQFENFQSIDFQRQMQECRHLLHQLGQNMIGQLLKEVLDGSI